MHIYLYNYQFVFEVLYLKMRKSLGNLKAKKLKMRCLKHTQKRMSNVKFPAAHG